MTNPPLKPPYCPPHSDDKPKVGMSKVQAKLKAMEVAKLIRNHMRFDERGMMYLAIEPVEDAIAQAILDAYATGALAATEAFASNRIEKEVA